MNTVRPKPITPSSVLAFVSFITGVLIPPVAITAGHLALRRIRRSGGRGHALALVGMSSGYLGVILWTALIVSAANPAPTAVTSSVIAPAIPSASATATATATPEITPSVASPEPLPVAVSTSPAIHSVHSPGVVAVDVNLTAGECHVIITDAATGDFLPDAYCTPGGIDPAVTQANIAATICASGYTKTVRPRNISAAKTASLADYGMAAAHSIEYDHLVSLELGGTNSVSNLWPEPNANGVSGFNNPKDTVENALHAAVCAGHVTLAAAQQAIASDWTTAERVLHLAG